MMDVVKGWLRRLAHRTTQPLLDPLPPVRAYPPLPVTGYTPYTEAQRRYLADKQEAIRRQADRVARVKRLGYDLDTVLRKGP